MAFRNDRRKKAFFSRIFGLKEKKASKGNQNPLDFSAEFQEVPAFSAPASPLFMERFSGKEPSSMLERINFSKLSSATPNILESKDFRVFVATCNVGGKPPHIGLDLNDFIPADDQSDIYVLGFQEIVPLNAGNVLVIEDSEPAIKWLGLINQALNRPIEIEGYACPRTPSKYTSSPPLAFGAKSSVFKDSKTTASPFFQKPSLKAVSRTFRTELGRRLKTCNCRSEMARKYCRDSCFRCPQSYLSVDDSSDEEEMETSGPVITDLAAAVAVSTTTNHLRYNLIASKQMVGIFITIWVKREHVQHIGHLRLSSVGRGILGCLGNKGCISVSMSLYQTSFCFVCCHLASGAKEGDELRRNCDVIEILKSTQFPKICKTPNRRIPERILEHDRVIWLGDLNYRIALSYSETKKLLNDNDWDALFEKDQLKIEREAGRVFKGWNEGKIYFAPTYKYSDNSDAYTGESVTSKKKRRTPAWCDRILWHGDGIMQLSYVRGESRFSDHRPVCAVFVVEVGVADGRLRKSSSSSNMKVGAEELLPPSSGYYPI